MAVETWNYVADRLDLTFLLLAVAATSAVGTPVRVAPFDDEVLSKLGVWLMGKAEDVAAVREKMDAALKKAKVKFSAMRWKETRRRG